MTEQGYSLQDVTGLFRRRWKLMAGITLATFLGSAIVAYSLQNLYRATAEIDIQCPEVTDLPGVACGEVDRSQRIDRLNDEVMSRENLAALVEKYDLYPEERGDGQPASVLREMRPNINVELTFDEEGDPRSRRPGEIMGFTVSFMYGEPAATRDVTRELASLFVRASAERSNAAELNAKTVLQGQVDDLRRRLQAQEAKLAEFQIRNPGAMPEDRSFNRTQLERKQTELASVDRQIRDLESQLQIIANQLANTEPYIGLGVPGDPGSLENCRALQTEYRDLLARYSPQHPDVIQMRRKLEQVCGATGTGMREIIELQLATRQAELDELRRGLPPEHPDVRQLERIVQSLEQDLANAPEENASRAPDNPVYVQLAIRQQSLRSEAGALRGRRDGLVTQIASLEERLQIAPEVEREIKELERGYDQAKKAFEAAEAKKIIIEGDRLGEKWVLHKGPSFPYVPAFPNRPLILVIGLFLGLTLAAIAVLVIEALDGTVRGTRDVNTLLEMPPIAAVPFVATARDVSRARTRRFAAIAGTFFAIVLTGAYVYIQRGGIT